LERRWALSAAFVDGRPRQTEQTKADRAPCQAALSAQRRMAGRRLAMRLAHPAALSAQRRAPKSCNGRLA